MQALRHTCGMGLCVALYIASPPLVRGPTTKARTVHIESPNALSLQGLSRTAGQFEAIAPEPSNKNVSRHASARSSLQPNACILHIVSFIASASHERLVTHGSLLQRLVLASRLRYPLSLNAKQGGT